MSGALLAAASGVGFGVFQSINVRALRGTDDSYASTFVQVGTATVALATVALLAGELDGLLDAPLWAIGDFALAGLLHFLGGWSLLNLSQHRIGAARTGPLLTTVPVFGVVIAAVTIGQLPGAVTLLAIALMCAGAYLVAVRGGSVPGRFADALPALGCAAMWALSPIFILRGLEGFDSPMAGFTVGLIVSVLAYAPVLALVRGGDRAWTSVKGSIGVLKLVAGVLVGAATWSRWAALEDADVGAVLALNLLSVPTVLLLAPIVAGRHLERVTLGLWAGAGLRDLRRARTGGRGVTRVIDMHAHAIVPELLRAAAPAESWRPRVWRDGDHQAFEVGGREVRSAVREWTDLERILADQDAAGTDVVLLSPLVLLLGHDAEPAEGLRRARIQNAGLARMVAMGGGRVAALGAVPLQDPGARGDGAARADGDGVLRGVEVARERERPLPRGRRVRAVLGRGGGDRRARLHPSRPRADSIPPCSASTTSGTRRQPARDHGDRRAPRADGDDGAPSGPARLLLAHGGGTILALRGRLRHAHWFQPQARSRLRESPDASLRRFLYDTVVHEPGCCARWSTRRRRPRRAAPTIRSTWATCARPPASRAAGLSPRPRPPSSAATPRGSSAWR